MSSLSPSDTTELHIAARRLETQSFAMTIASKAGIPAEALLRMVPNAARTPIAAAVNKALGQCLRLAIRSGSPDIPIRHRRSHTAAVALTGALGGFFGLPGLLVELPVTTTVMLHSIVEIARAHGEDLSNPESALACLEVLALGPHGVHSDLVESAYYAARAAMMQTTREAAASIAQKGITKEGAPALTTFLGKIASRFGLEVSDKTAADLLPIAGAAGGLALNVLFIRHFERLAEGHFTIRRLERRYGQEVVRQEYNRARLLR